MQAETQRKIEHMIPVAFAVLLRWIPLWLAVLLAALSVVYGAVVSPRLFRRMLRGDESALGFSPGKFIYGAAVLVMIIVFRESGFHVVAGAWALMGIGDGMSNIIGRARGRAKLPWSREKSWEGFAAFVAFGAVAAGLLVWFVGARAEGPQPTLCRSMVCALIAAAAAGAVETLSSRLLDDNITVPAVGAIVLYALTVATSLDPTLSMFAALALTAALGFASLRAGAVDSSGFVAGLAIGAAVSLTLMLPGFLLLALMFVMGTLTTRWGYARKAASGIAQEAGGRRSWMNATAKCVVPVACALLARFGLSAEAAPAMVLAFAAALATAAMDTVSSELGPLYGRVTVLLPSCRRATPGTEGAVSLEGTLLGLAGAAVMAAAAAGLALVGWRLAWVIPASALAGTTIESLLGAAGLGRTPASGAWLNLVNSAVGAAVALVLGGAL